MRIKTRPFGLTLDGQPTSYIASVVGVAPHRTYFIEEDAGVIADRDEAPALVGQLIRREVVSQKFQELCEQHTPQEADYLIKSGKAPVSLPDIPGVTTEGTWKNPSFSQKNHTA